MKILYVLEHYDPYIGGVEKLFKRLCAELVVQGHSVRVLTTRFNSNLPQQEFIDGVDVIRLPVSNRYIFTFFGFFFGYKYSKGFDLIHTTSYNAALPGFLIGFFRRKRAVITFHEVWSKLWFKLPFLPSIERVLFFLYEQFVLMLPFHYFIAVSDFTATELLKRKRQDVVCRIYNGLEYREATIPIKKGSNFLYFGRLGVSKGLDVLLDACELLFSDGFNFKLTLIIPKVPDGLYQKIISLVASSSYSSQVTIKHNLSDQELENEIRIARCVIIPSYSEGFCFAAAEVCSLGTNLIHSGKGALPEVVSGTFMELDELTPVALASAMKMAHFNKWTSTPLKKFLLEDTVQEYIDLYQRLI